MAALAGTYSNTHLARGGSGCRKAARHRAAQKAEESEREAHLDGQAKTHGGDRGPDNRAESNSTDSNPYDDEFLPGSRHVPTR